MSASGLAWAAAQTTSAGAGLAHAAGDAAAEPMTVIGRRNAGACATRYTPATPASPDSSGPVRRHARYRP